MDISRGSLGCKGDFPSSVAEKMNFVTPNVLLQTLCVFLDNPTAVWVRHLSWFQRSSFITGCLFTTAFFTCVRPSFNISAIYRQRLSKTRQLSIHTANEATHDILDGKGVRLPRKFRSEARESRLARNLVGRRDTASVGYVGVVLEDANEVRDRGKSQVVVSHVAPPEDLRVISWPAASPWASELCQEFFIGKLREDCLKLGYYWGSLSIRTEYSIIKGGHSGSLPFLIGLGAAGVSSTCGSDLFILG